MAGSAFVSTGGSQSSALRGAKQRSAAQKAQPQAQAPVASYAAASVLCAAGFLKRKGLSPTTVTALQAPFGMRRP